MNMKQPPVQVGWSENYLETGGREKEAWSGWGR